MFESLLSFKKKTNNNKKKTIVKLGLNFGKANFLSWGVLKTYHFPSKRFQDTSAIQLPLLTSRRLKDQQLVGGSSPPPRFPSYISNVRKAARRECILRRSQVKWKPPNHSRGGLWKRSLLFSFPDLSPLMMKPRPLLEGRRFISINLHSWHNFQTFSAALRPVLWPGACRTNKEEGIEQLCWKKIKKISLFVWLFGCCCFFFFLTLQYISVRQLWIYSILSQNKSLSLFSSPHHSSFVFISCHIEPLCGYIFTTTPQPSLCKVTH